MSDIHVACIMLIADRRELGEKAVECFRRQTYENKSLVIFDTGKKPFREKFQNGMPVNWWWENPYGRTIGELRNRAAEISTAKTADILVHWDSDDWSHPRRIEEQVKLLKDSRVECVGYSDMLFWDERKRCAGCSQVVGCQHRPSCPRQGIVSMASVYSETPHGEAWLWTGARNRPIGTSLCYWRRIWEAHPFAHLPKSDSIGEDVDFVRRSDCLANSSLSPRELPAMVARIHDGNTSSGYREIESSSSWKRVPSSLFGTFCRRVMA